MKKVILIIAIALTSSSINAQTICKVLRTSYETYVGGEWVEQTFFVPQKMFVILKKELIKITNEDESIYIVYGEPKKTTYSTHTTNTWEAYDKDGKDCSVMIKVPIEESTLSYLSILYNNGTCFNYTIEKSE